MLQPHSQLGLATVIGGSQQEKKKLTHGVDDDQVQQVGQDCFSQHSGPEGHAQARLERHLMKLSAAANKTKMLQAACLHIAPLPAVAS